MDNKTLCWTCKNAVGDCSWSRRFEPVEGWTAEPTKIKLDVNSGAKTDSFCVIKCPEYVPDEREVKPNPVKEKGTVDVKIVKGLKSKIGRALKKGSDYTEIARFSGVCRDCVSKIHKGAQTTTRLSTCKQISEGLDFVLSLDRKKKKKTKKELKKNVNTNRRKS